MKSLVPLAFGLLASCAITDAPATSTATSAASTTTSTLTDVTQSEDWVVGKGTADSFWPTGLGITSTQVLIRKGPCRYDTNGNCTIQTFMAVVVWNHSTVSHIYWVNKGSDGSDFHTVLDNTLGTRCNTNPDHNGGTDGAPYVGTPPTPHPNVDGLPVFDVDATFLKNAKDAALALDNATGPQSAFATYVTQ